jgi:hypothetical protein
VNRHIPGHSLGLLLRPRPLCDSPVRPWVHARGPSASRGWAGQERRPALGHEREAHPLGSADRLGLHQRSRGRRLHRHQRLGGPGLWASLSLAGLCRGLLGSDRDHARSLQPLGAIIATYFLVTGITGLQLLGVASFARQLFYGGALVMAVALSQIARRRMALDIGGEK